MLALAELLEHLGNMKMDISPETAIDHLRRWKSSACRLSLSIDRQSLRVFSQATVSAVTRNMVVFAFAEPSDGLTLILDKARYRSFLPSEPIPPEFGGSHKACLLLLLITLKDGSLCKVCELSDQANFPVILFADTDSEIPAEPGQK